MKGWHYMGRWGLALLMLGQLFLGGADARLFVETPRKVDMGDPFVLQIESDADVDEATVRWLNENIVVALEEEGGRRKAQVLLGSQTGKTKPGRQDLTVTVKLLGRQEKVRESVTVRDKRFPITRLTVEKAMVSPPQKELARIQEERKIVRAALGTRTAERFWSLPFARPVPGVVTSGYGGRRVLNGTPKAPHGGVDFRAKAGTSVKCPAAGKVLLTGDHYFAGKSVYVDHGHGAISIFMHLSRIDVQVGDEVKAGQRIGLSGSSGRSTGPHLHYGLSLAGELVDPLTLFKK